MLAMDSYNRPNLCDDYQRIQKKKKEILFDMKSFWNLQTFLLFLWLSQKKKKLCRLSHLLK